MFLVVKIVIGGSLLLMCGFGFLFVFIFGIKLGVVVIILIFGDVKLVIMIFGFILSF